LFKDLLQKAVQPSGAVRGISTVLFEWRQLENGNLKVRQFLSADPKGSLPSFLVNSMKTKTAEQLTAIRKILAK
jgi:hypothetical protein